MKRLVSLVILLVCLINLSGCRHAPQNITFIEGIGNISAEDITKITIKSTKRESFESRETESAEKITSLLNSLSDQTFTRNADQSLRVGWTYSINLYTNNSPGWVGYTLDTGFGSYEGYKGQYVDGFYSADDPDKVESILEDFYNQLEAQPDQQ